MIDRVLGCFTILHYGNVNVTIKCIDCLLKLNNIEKCRILVLDNDTRHDNAKILSKVYKDNALIDIYKADENLGFTRGNNYLYQKAKYYAPSFIAIMNNDVEIYQIDYVDVLLNIVDKSNYYVIGPDVYKPSTHDHQSPLMKDCPSYEEVTNNILPPLKQIIDNGTINRKDVFIHNLMIAFHKYSPGFVMNWYKKNVSTDLANTSYFNEMKNVVLQGSCVIFTYKYIEREECAFEPDTNFYCEEMLLCLKCKMKNYATLYTPKLNVIHQHALASKSDFKNYSELEYITSKRMYSALLIYLKCLKNTSFKGE